MNADKASGMDIQNPENCYGTYINSFYKRNFPEFQDVCKEFRIYFFYNRAKNILKHESQRNDWPNDSQQ